jgi:flagellar hook-basal body complex protein FliE
MNLPSENKKPTGLSLSQLVQRNAEALETREMIPYQHTVYAIPEEWRKKEEQLLADAVQFQPTLHRLITNLATREEFTQMQTDQKMQIYQVLGRHTKDVENQLQRDGKAREKFSTDLSRKLSESLQDLDKAKESLERTCRKWVLIAAGVSAASSMLACILCLLLAG